MNGIVNTNRNLIVAKYGSETVADEINGIFHNKLDQYALGLSELDSGLIVVTSGAVMAGKADAPHITDDQALAGIGSSTIVEAWKRAFRRFGITVSQVLATDYEISDVYEGGNLRKGLLKDVSLGIVPVFNTNDKLNTEEVKKRLWKGDNDGPASHIAVFMGASALCLMTKKNGLFDDDGETINIIPYDPTAHESVNKMIESRGSSVQGIAAKIKAAINAAHYGVEAYIAGADENIQEVLAGQTGTHIVANTTYNVE